MTVPPSSPGSPATKPSTSNKLVGDIDKKRLHTLAVLGEDLYALAQSCFVYATDGTSAPPEALVAVCRRREARAAERAYGLKYIHSLITSLSSRSAKQVGRDGCAAESPAAHRPPLHLPST